MRGKGPTGTASRASVVGYCHPAMTAPHVIQGREAELLALHMAMDPLSKRVWFSFLPVGGTRVASPWSHTPPPSWVSFRVQRQSAPGKTGSIHPSSYTPILSPVLSQDEPSASLSHSQLLNSHRGIFSSPCSMGRNVGTITMKRETRHLILERGRLAPVAGEGGCF